MASVVSAQPIVLSTVPQQQQPAGQATQCHKKTIKDLALTQLIIGLLCLILGIAEASRKGPRACFNHGAGVWFGVWIALTGALGRLYVARFNINSTLNQLYMSFSIICTVISAIAAIFIAISVVIYSSDKRCAYDYRRDVSNGRVGLGLNIPLLLLMSVEFFVSIVAAVYCCKVGCCWTNSNMISFQQQPQLVMIALPNSNQAYQATVPIQPYQANVPLPPYQVNVPNANQPYQGNVMYPVIAPVGPVPSYNDAIQQVGYSNLKFEEKAPLE